jgi:hypothetical protein
MGQVDGKVAIVTGGGSGIGAQAAPLATGLYSEKRQAYMCQIPNNGPAFVV